MQKILITGAAGFIGYHLSKKLTGRGENVVGLDNLNDYYDVNLKFARLKQLDGIANFRFVKLALENSTDVTNLFSRERFDIVVNLAAQAGVRYSLKNPRAYIDSNVVGFLNVLEGCRNNAVKHLVFASSSSVYGANTSMPFSVHHNVDHPVSLYAATKKANELMAHAYASLYRLPCTGLRFFTVYGPWGRPDMAYYSFTKAILDGQKIDIFNHGNMKRDFSYIDDVIEGVTRVLGKIPQPDSAWDGNNPDPGTSYSGYKLYNIGNNSPISLLKFVQIIEDCLGRKAEKNYLPMQAGDIQATYADVDDLMADVGFRPSTPVEEGIRRFVDWYREYHQIKS